MSAPVHPRPYLCPFFKLHLTAFLCQISDGFDLIWWEYNLYKWKIMSVWRFHHPCPSLKGLMSSRTKSLSRFLLSLSIYWSTLSSVAEFFIKLLSSESSSSGLILASAYCSRGFLDEKEELRAKSLILTCSSKSSLVSDSKISSISGRVCLKKWAGCSASICKDL